MSSGHGSALIAIEWLTMVVRAIDQQPAYAALAHFGKGYLSRAGESGHAPLKRGKSVDFTGYWQRHVAG
jgi:hypothetical protein